MTVDREPEEQTAETVRQLQALATPEGAAALSRAAVAQTGGFGDTRTAIGGRGAGG